MPSIPSVLRHVFCALSCGAALATAAGAEELPGRKFAPNDIRRALIWTGHYSVFTKGDGLAIYNEAVKAWQAAKHYPAGEELSPGQASELVAEAEARRDAVGWSMLEDKAVGFSVGLPTRLVKFTGARSSNGALRYTFEGGVGYSIGVYYGGTNCTAWAQKVKAGKISYRDERWNNFSVVGTDEGRLKYLRGLCQPSGSLLVTLDISELQAPAQQVLFSAMAESLQVERVFDATALPRPRIEAVAPLAGDLFPVSTSRTTSRGKPAADIDKSGKTDAIKRESRAGGDLTAEQAFEKISPAVFMVDAGDRLGSAVAIGEHDLLTNCHVVKEVAQVTLRRAKTAETADVVSIDQKADRCILRTKATLAKWVTVRPYDDIKVGERAITIGTPQGLELTIAEGIVSSKRSFDDARLVQTTAAVSQGSSGGGLFDGQGRLLGITTFYLQGGQNLNFAVAGEDFAK